LDERHLDERHLDERHLNERHMDKRQKAPGLFHNYYTRLEKLDGDNTLAYYQN
jgi:hypothetical protein